MPYIHSQHPPSDLLDAMSQTMLLTKRLTTFLSQNTSPQLPTLLLISPTGKLLSSSSPLPASKLRSQATIACTLWNLYQPFQQNSSDLISTALSLPFSSSPSQAPQQANTTPVVSTPTPVGNDQNAIMMQLSDGIMVIHALKCDLLFVAIGASSSTSPYPSSRTLHSQAQHVSTSPLGSPPSSPSQQHGDDTLSVGTHGERDGHRDMSGSSLGGLGSSAPSEAGSVGSTSRMTQASFMAVKRQAEEVGKWLEGSLEGFVLSSGDGR